ncbi:MAG: O-acetyl-ADP-ribose deacetylase [Pelotomaculum sp. PtaB.Bin013]|uniref:O-acetyl-ADP-ribose deacetylase n=1 Tax=Pelotomaculum isophthalicicum JI TaxID=947010 RepID=A0A9X4H2L2_9FIRM|nr:O-acetyl-ADP-ribose deacetylase [Pelotomaculum isophthalicicum]MDF9408476.1 O-acetyl-ADP-ribose deacetylase [Pelotomaculum isophthalicicum JI]OPX89734.1 MAG: O-acetyl-ADP-ribose deacetylase [Pelotomaculum sp. PtaB.Bin013]
METLVGKTLLKIIKGDITVQNTEAVVNAANSGLLGGGGVDGAIHRAGGPAILEECIKIRSSQGGCPTGQAVLTGGGNLKARYVIHTVGPIWHGGNNNEDELLRDAYLNSLTLAKKHGIRSVSFPSISTGAYRFPVGRAAGIALRTVRDFINMDKNFEEIRFILYTEQLLKEFELAWNKMEHDE